MNINNPAHEVYRIEALKLLNLLDTPPEREFDYLTQTAAELLNVPIALISLIETKREWFKSSYGFNVNEINIKNSFCAHAIYVEEALIVEDAKNDIFFKDKPWVAEDPYICFYAGFPLLSTQGYRLGTLCVMDIKPKTLSEYEYGLLKKLAHLSQIALRHKELTGRMHELYNKNKEEKVGIFKNTFELAAVGIMHTSPSGQLIRINSQACRMLGYTEDFLEKINFQAITHPDDLEKNLNLFNQALSRNIDSYCMEKRLLKASGDYIWVSLNARLSRTPEGEPNYFIATIEDISHRKSMEEAIQYQRNSLEEEVKSRTYELEAANLKLISKTKKLEDTKKDIIKRKQRIKMITDNIPALIAYWDKNMICRFANKAYKEWFNRHPKQVIGIKLEELLGQELFQKNLPYIELALRGQQQKFERKLIKTNGSERYTEAHYIPDIQNRSVEGFFVMVYDITERRQIEEALREQEMLRNLSAYQERIKEDERKRIAREIHDELGSLLMGIKAYLSVAINSAENAKAPLDKQLVNASNLADSAMETVRKVINDLRPSVLDQLGLWAALEWYSNQIAEQTSLVCQLILDASITAIEVSSDQSTALFRVVQEALTNVVRHAEATHVSIHVFYRAPCIMIEISDNGKGIKPSYLLNRKSWGITGMHERVRYFGGELTISTTPGNGTIIRLQMPLESHSV